MSNSITFNIHNNILIVGKATTKYGLLEVLYWDNPDTVDKCYGADSNLAKAFHEAYNMGVTSIFLLNVQKKRDNLEIIEILRQNDFAYVAFTDLYASDTFVDAADPNAIHNYFAYILGTIGLDHESVFMVTDKHASLFENIDDFIDYMNNTTSTFIEMCSGMANRENIIIVANNLVNHEYANVTLAASICTTEVNAYPTYDFGNAFFYIDQTDSPTDFAYFKNQAQISTTVENLINCKDSGAEKVFPVSRVIKYIKRSLDFDEFKGRFYTKIIKMRINKKLDEYLKSITGSIINDYEIYDVIAYKGDPGTIKIMCYYAVQPAFSFEICKIQQEVII